MELGSASYMLRSLPREFAVLGGPDPPDDDAFRSERLQILWNCSDEAWADPGQHIHEESDEVFIVLKGAIEVAVEHERFTVGAGEVCFFPAGCLHAIVDVRTPVEAFVIRVPAVDDKVYLDTIDAPGT